MSSPLTIQTFLITGRTQQVLAQGVALIEQHYQGQPFGWRDGGPSIRELATNHDIAHSAVYRCLATASLWMSVGRPELSHLSVSHLREILSFDVETQQEVLGQAERERWTVARLKREREARTPKRRRANRNVFALEAIRAWMQNPQRLEGIDDLDRLSDKERAKLTRALQTMQMELEMLSYRLKS